MTTDTRSPAQDDADEIDLRQLLGTLIDHKWWIAGITGAFFAVAAAYALLATPIYRADAIVQVESKVPSLPGLSDISQSLGIGGGTAEATTEIALITSRAVVGGAVDALKLDITIEPNRFPLLGGYVARKAERADPGALADVRFGMSRFGWGGEKLEIFQLDVPRALLARPMTLIVGENSSYELFDEDDNLLLKGQVGKVASGKGVTAQIAEMRAHPGMRFEVTRQRGRAAEEGCCK